MLNNIFYLLKRGLAVKPAALLLFCLFAGAEAFGQPRDFSELFPEMEAARKNEVFSGLGIVEYGDKSFALKLLPDNVPAANLAGPILEVKPSFFMETLLVAPYSAKIVSLIDIYNAVSKIRNLQGRLYNSYSRKEAVPLFEEAARVEGVKKLNKTIPDPPYINEVPDAETLYVRLKDVNFGNTYYRVDFLPNAYGLLCVMTNIKNLSYLIMPIIKEEKFMARFYLEPITEGILIYGIAWTDVSDFISSHVDIPSAIQKRFTVILEWVVDGLSG